MIEAQKVLAHYLVSSALLWTSRVIAVGLLTRQYDELKVMTEA